MATSSFAIDSNSSSSSRRGKTSLLGRSRTRSRVRPTGGRSDQFGFPTTRDDQTVRTRPPGIHRGKRYAHADDEKETPSHYGPVRGPNRPTVRECVTGCRRAIGCRPTRGDCLAVSVFHRVSQELSYLSVFVETNG